MFKISSREKGKSSKLTACVWTARLQTEWNTIRRKCRIFTYIVCSAHQNSFKIRRAFVPLLIFFSNSYFKTFTTNFEITFGVSLYVLMIHKQFNWHFIWTYRSNYTDGYHSFSHINTATTVPHIEFNLKKNSFIKWCFSKCVNFVA